MEEIIIQLIMNNGNFKRKINIYNNGKIESINNNTVTEKNITILSNIIDYLEKSINNGYKKSMFDDKCIIKYKDISIQSGTIFSDIEVMIRNDKPLETVQNNTNQIRNEKEKQKEEENKRNEIIIKNEKIIKEKYKNIPKLDLKSLENNKNNIINNSIKFNLVSKEKFEIGETCFFTDFIDIDPNINYPEELEFVGQINLKEFSQYDQNNILPKTGYLYFFQGPTINNNFYNFGKVIYSNKEELSRKNTFIYDKNLVINLGINNIKNEKDIYTNNEDENKIFGYLTNAQMNEDEINIISSNYVVLLQLGATIYGEGTTTFLIKKDDLINLNFENIIYIYSQS